MSGMVRELALRTPVTALPEIPICQAEQQVISGNVREIYIVDEQDRLLGQVPEVEFLNYRLLGGDGMGRIASLMGTVDLTLSAQATLEEAVIAFKDPRYSSLAVLQGERLIGILFRADLLRLLIEQGTVRETSPLPATFPVPAPKFSQFTQAGEFGRLFDREFTFGR